MITRKHRLLSGFVAVLMLISLFTAFVLPVSADGEFPVYDANAETYFNSTKDYNAPRGSQYDTYSSSTIFVVADAADREARNSRPYPIFTRISAESSIIAGVFPAPTPNAGLPLE